MSEPERLEPEEPLDEVVGMRETEPVLRELKDGAREEEDDVRLEERLEELLPRERLEPDERELVEGERWEELEE